MSHKIFITGLLIVVGCFGVSAQRIVVDTTSSNKYLLKKETPEEPSGAEVAKGELSFSDRAVSIGKGILNRLKARFNLEEAAESIKEKKDKILGKEEEKEDGG